jgi:predicted ATP-dependent serine protease
MITCPKCGQIIREIGELSEVRSLGLALRGKCPSCEAWVFCDELWKKTKTIDKTRVRATTKNQEKRPKKGHTKTSKARENRLETVLLSRY